ncbi:GNAT family N-acetyltransferase [Shewanella psychrotolerans]|uniref:GNAT family N-acetyltransferase n=1 Tax=Shewanella psychrotolerans TaxID=2864206 RepID=UPI001C657ED9|nr:GNAT family N-acetyltransferase [Shewanella psychrotolerans]QYK02471.1 GNAT family N-acetyltransferase [Shewanella psychrotolerans]
MYKVIPYVPAYALQVSKLYHLAVQEIDETLYSAEQKQAWSKAPRSAYHWNKRLSRSKAWIMIDTALQVGDDYLCLGFINVETHFNSRGYIDSLYVLPERQGEGVASALYQTLEQWAKDSTVSRLSVDASKLSKRLFLSQGFKFHHNRYQEKCGEIFLAFYLSKQLA